LELAIAATAFWLAFNGWFALIAVIVVLGYIAFTVTTTEWRLKFRREMNKRDTEAAGKAVDSLLNYETVKYFSAENFEVERYDNAMAGYLSAYNIIQGDMSIGDMSAVVMVMMQLYRPLNILGFAYREIKQALTDLEKMFILMGLRPEIIDSPDAKDIYDVQGHITFRDVTFSYDDDRVILNNISFDIPRGQTVAVVGPTGAGKSTLSRILFRFYDIRSGEVCIDGISIENIKQESLREIIGIVPQDTVLFNDTIAYNIRYAKPDASQEVQRVIIPLSENAG